MNGHNKDHRPDLKQLVWSLTVSSDGAVPIHYNVYDGNAPDDRTHLETWETLRAIAGSPTFFYVADCKLCTRENMEHIARPGGRLLTALPRSRREDGWFKAWILDHPADWKVIWDRPPLPRKLDAPERFEAVEAPETSAEGYRIVWYRSSEKWRRHERARDHAIQTARQELERLRARVGRRNLETHEQVQAAVDAILDETQARVVELTAIERHTHRQAGPGRPGKNTRYVRRTTIVHEPVVTLDAEEIRASVAADGIFPLIIDASAEEKSPLEFLQIYKHQPFLEKRHEQLETAAEVVPVNFKSPERIEAFLFLYFIAAMLHALIERKVRTGMKDRKPRSIPLYPEERACRAPTADKVLDLFEPLRRHRLFKDHKPMKTFWDHLTPLQRLVLELLGVPPSSFGG